MKAIISDIHSNLEALQAVLADIKSLGITEVYCLGDVVGYGPNPRECIDLVMEHCTFCLLGNHDQGALYDPDGFNVGAERAIFWTRAQLESPTDRANNEKRWEFLGELPRTRKYGPFLFVHGSPRN
ncbi:MAG TPA: metallophosphoesterase family protein, partial [Gemmatimonadales bacterium]|nr:metallophosphoesterase family protein [Gemmatimonadales bacterium]